MRTQFYCSSQFKEGYVYGEKADGLQMVKIASTCADVFFIGSGVDSVLFRSGGKLILALKGIKTPENMKTRTDKTRSPIHINIAFMAEKVYEEAALRSLYLFFLKEEQAFSGMLFEAYDESAGGETGYDFDQSKLNGLFKYAEANDPLEMENRLERSEKGLFHAVDRQEAAELLSHFTMPVEDGVYLLETDLTQSNYVRKYMRQGDSLPWYVLGNGGEEPAPGGRESAFSALAHQILRRLGVKWIAAGAAALVGLVALAVVLSNRTVPISNPSISCEVIAADAIRYSWQADGASGYAVTFNGTTEKLGAEVTNRTYQAKQGGAYDFQVIGYGRNDREGTLVGASLIYLAIPTPSPTPVPTPTPAPASVPALYAENGKITLTDLTMDEPHVINVQIDDQTVLELRLSPSGTDVSAAAVSAGQTSQPLPPEGGDTAGDEPT